MINNYFCKLVLLALATLGYLQAEEAPTAPIALEVVEPASFCHFNPIQDQKTKYCGFWGMLDIPEYPNNMRQLSLKTSLYYTSIIDLSLLSFALDPAVDVSLQFSLANDDPGAFFLPQMTNISSGDLAAMRRYYEAECVEPKPKQHSSWMWREGFARAEANAECSKVELHGIHLQRSFHSRFIVMIADSRLAAMASGFI